MPHFDILMSYGAILKLERIFYMEHMLKNKLYLIIFLLIVITLSFSNNVLGANYTTSELDLNIIQAIENSDFYKSGNYKIFCIHLKNADVYRTYIIDKTIYKDINIKIDGSLLYFSSECIWSCIDYKNDGTVSYTETNISSRYYRDDVINFDKYYNYQMTVLLNGEPDFFQTTPLLAQVEEIPKTMNKVLQMIIPIGLLILSTVLVISVVKLVLSQVI